MPDDLRDRFDEFRAESMAYARPPGVDAVRRRVARRRSARAAALALVAIAVLVLTWLPGDGGRGPAPIIPPTPTPTPTPTVSAPASPSGPGPSSRSAPRRSVTDPPSGNGPSCPHAERFLTHADPDTYAISTELINACPTVTLRLVRVTYAGLGATPNTLTRYDTESHTVTPSVRIATFRSASRPSGTCYAFVSVTVVSSGGTTPASIPNILPGAEAGGDPLSAIQTWFVQHGYPLLDGEWGDPQC